MSALGFGHLADGVGLELGPTNCFDAGRARAIPAGVESTRVGPPVVGIRSAAGRKPARSRRCTVRVIEAESVSNSGREVGLPPRPPVPQMHQQAGSWTRVQTQALQQLPGLASCASEVDPDQQITDRAT